VGKSSLALHYAQQYRESYALVWWITAESAESIVSGLAGLAMALCPQWAGAVGSDERAAWAVLWLQEHEGWLLVFDNVEDPGVLKPYVGTLHRGHHLATSRKATGWHVVTTRPMALGVLPLEDAVDLLTRLAFADRAPTGEEWAAATELARDLGCLPLALEQAGAYVHQTGTGLEEYRRLLGLVLDEASEGIDPERTIARIWDQTIVAVAGRDPLAVRLLDAMAWLAPDDIPRAYLVSLTPDLVALNRALGVLHTYNMVSFGDQNTLKVHRLVQAVLRNRPHGPEDPPPGRLDAEHALQHALPSANQDDIADNRWQEFVPHIIALAENTPVGIAPNLAMANVYLSVAQTLFRQLRDGQTVTLRQQVLAQREHDFRDTDSSTVVARHNLARAYTEAGHPERAIPLLETVLAQFKQTVGDAHPYALAARHNLARAYTETADLERAVPLLKTVLAQSEQVLGNTHPNTLNACHSLAFAYSKTGDLERAICLLETVLPQFERTIGDIRPSTLSARHDLAVAYAEIGDMERAVPLLKTVLTQSEQVLGNTHPNTLRARDNLATARAQHPY
ncbi:tetratricopeptide repeat protein, partial [Streptomyces sp. S3(2020)]|uniref:tetratricopeptide repeat protein n=1 Tax=Streptomyces sp. S3(2020) TaxID=2732044 RepID=UPI001487F0EB